MAKEKEKEVVKEIHHYHYIPYPIYPWYPRITPYWYADWTYRPSITYCDNSVGNITAPAGYGTKGTTVLSNGANTYKLS